MIYVYVRGEASHGQQKTMKTKKPTIIASPVRE